MSRSIKHVAVILPDEPGYSNRVRRGMGLYALKTECWTFEFMWGFEEAAETLKRHKPDGIIVDPRWYQWISRLNRLDVPLVTVTKVPGEPEANYVGVDEPAVGRMAAGYFRKSGYTNLGFCGYPNNFYSEGREEGFRDELAGTGVKLQLFKELFDTNEQAYQGELKLRQWIDTLSKPVAIFACHDALALRLLQICRYANIRVPYDVAILGVDNREDLCEFSHPPLSSIDTGPERIGYEAAVLLDKLIHSESAPSSPVLIPPLEVVTRQSTDVMAVYDEIMIESLQFIRDNAARPIGVEDILRVVPAGRRKLERLFRKTLGRSPLSEIRRQHVERAKRLLSQTDMSMYEIAKACGFPHGPHMAKVFRSETGMTPTQYRKQFFLLRSKHSGIRTIEQENS